jgi:hypothetical protein
MTEIIVRRLAENDISTADCVYRLAFGTFVGLHDPIQFSGDADPIGTRFRAIHPLLLQLRLMAS